MVFIIDGIYNDREIETLVVQKDTNFIDIQYKNFSKPVQFELINNKIEINTEEQLIENLMILNEQKSTCQFIYNNMSVIPDTIKKIETEKNIDIGALATVATAIYQKQIEPVKIEKTKDAWRVYNKNTEYLELSHLYIEKSYIPPIPATKELEIKK